MKYILIIVIILILKKIIEESRWNQFWQEEGEQQIQEFFNEVEVLKTHYIAHHEEVALKNKWEELKNKVSKLKIPEKYDFYPVVQDFLKTYSDITTIVKTSNDSFVKSEKIRCDNLFSNIDSRSLDDQQRTAVVTDEDHMLILAGAGSGKTLTISGKVKYLCEEKHINPEEILLIAYTNKAADEMTERIGRRMGLDVKAVTFHKLGKDIIVDNSNKTFDIIDNLDEFLRNYFETVVIKDSRLVQKLIEYYAYYLCIPTNIDDFDSLGEAYEHQKNMDFETIKSKYDKYQFSKLHANDNKINTQSLKGEELKSLEEVTIANFLFLNGVKYEYERPYPFQDDSPEHRMYKPDFYLSDYDIYLEHFGINKNSKTPWLSDIEEEKYLSGMEWKRNLHKQHNTKLLETYSYYSQDGILIEKLKALLIESGVEFREPDYFEIFDAIYEGIGERYFGEFMKLCATFITLLKSSGYDAEDIQGLKYKTKGHDSIFEKRRTQLFKDIITPVCEGYKEYLETNSAIDFSDMIGKATKLIEDNGSMHSYKYIIIDEFQDISIARYKLIKALLNATHAKLFCVGDDWQSIYRFAGSDISIFTDFEKSFGYSEILKIEQTYRYSQELVNETSRFILKNPLQLKKSLKAGKRLIRPLQFVIYRHSNDSYNPDLQIKIAIIIQKIISEFGDKSSILFLGRTKYDIEILKKSKLFTTKLKNNEYVLEYRNNPNLKVAFLSVHKAKGLEADNVILLNFQNKILGFPNKIADDPLLELVLSLEESFMYAEERRLLYVALTRTKNYSFVLVNESAPSEFLKEFGYDFNQNALSCPRCKTGKLVQRKNPDNGHLFLGCTNFPLCDYTIEDTFHKKCPECGGYMMLKKGKWGAFWSCTNYPHCKHSENAKDQKPCPKCGKPMDIKTGPYGIFWGCSGYPNCKYTENIIRETKKL